LKIAPTVASLLDKLIVQVLGPACVIVPVLKQLDDHPPKETPVRVGAVKVTVVFKG
jgi:hypothetical protein